jgi:hypothetical protein
VSEEEQSTRGVLVSRDEPHPADADDTSADFPRLAEWVAARWVPLTGLLLVAAQTWWMTALVGHGFFWIEDFYMVQRAADDGLSWNYLMWLEGGHLMPIGNLITWFLTRASLYNWTPFAVATLVLSAIYGLMLLRLLRVLFGDRPGILLLLAISLLSPLAFPGLSWWAVSSTQLPFQIALVGALTSHVHYLRSGRRRDLAATAIWVLVSIAGSDKGLATPFLLFAITSAYLVSGGNRWRYAAWYTLRRYWREWALLVGVLAVGLIVYFLQVGTSSSGFQSARALTGVFAFTWTLITASLIPGMLGGPWHWWGGSGYSMALAPQILVWLALAVGIVIIFASLAVRRGAWRAWVILLGWIVVVDVIPTLMGRGETFSATFLGHEARYVMEVPGIIAVLAGLIVLPLAPVAGPVAGPVAAQQRQPGRRVPALVVTAVASLMTVTLIGSIWSFTGYINGTTHTAARSYLATARLAFAQAPAGTVIVNSAVPMSVLGGLLPGPLSSDTTEAVLGPMIAGKSAPKFVGYPDGILDHLMEFDASGRLVEAVVYGPGSVAPRSCWLASGASRIVTMTATPPRNVEMRIGYVAASAGELAVTYDGQSSVLAISKGLHTLFLPASGSATTVSVTNLTAGIACVGDIEIGYLLPSSTGIAYPAQPVSG